MRDYTICIRRYTRSGRIVWWVSDPDSIPVAEGKARTHWQAFNLAIAALDQYRAGLRDVGESTGPYPGSCEPGAG